MSTKIQMIAMALLAMLNVTVCAQNLRIDKVEVRGREIKAVDGKYDLGVLLADKDVCKVTISNVGDKALEMEIRLSTWLVFTDEPKRLHKCTIQTGDRTTISFVCRREDKYPWKKNNTITIMTRINEQDEWAFSHIRISYYGISSEDEWALMERNGKWGAIDINQKTMIPFEYEALEEIHCMIAENRKLSTFMAQKSNKWGCISGNNKTIIPFEYEAMEKFGVFYVKAKKNGKWGILSNQTGKLWILFEYEEIGNEKCKKFSLIDGTPAKRNGKWGLVGEKGEFISCEYDDIKDGFSFGMYQVGKNGKWGAIDKNNHIVIPIEYEEMSDAFKFDELIYIDAKKNGKWGVIDSGNHIVIPFEYEDYIYFKKDGCAVVKKNGKWGKVDKNNKVVTQFVYDNWRDVKQ